MVVNQRYAMGVEYDGSRFYGWQRQRQHPTVQAVLETAVSRVADEPVAVHCAGRTDTGVHALAQVVHFDTRARRDERSWVLGTNSHLPAAASALWVRQVDTEFHARFSALSRSYRYTILNRWVRPALDRDRSAWVREPLDATAMQAAAQALVGEHDFEAFRAAGCQAPNPVRHVHRLAVKRRGQQVDVTVTANAFLYHMVRNIVGTLIQVGRGVRDAEWVAAVLHGRRRDQAGSTAPAAGLYFVGAEYPDHFGLPQPGTAPAWPRGWNLS